SVKAAGPAKREGTTVSGQVLDADGKPAPNALIYLFSRPGRGRTLPTAKKVATADAKGRFTCEVNPADRHQLASLVATAPGSAPGWAPLAGPAAGTTLRLAEDVPIKGRLLDLEGKPVAGAAVRVVSVGASDDGDLQPAFNAMRLNPEWLHLNRQVAAL